MSKKKLATLALLVCFGATAIAGASLAYFSDTEAATNVMTVGEVDIIQHETDETGKAFVNNTQKLFPYTGSGDGMDKANTVPYTAGVSPKADDRVMNPANNWISKVVTVENVGSENAYVRTLFAFQILEDGTIAADPVRGDLAWRTNHGLHYNMHQDIASVHFLKDAQDNYVEYTHTDGNKYIVGEYLYMNNGDSMIKPTEKTEPSLESIALEDYVDQETAQLYEGYTILVLSQAVQAQGFVDTNGNGYICDDALNAAFGALEDADQTQLAAWFAKANAAEWTNDAQ